MALSISAWRFFNAPSASSAASANFATGVTTSAVVQPDTKRRPPSSMAAIPTDLRIRMRRPQTQHEMRDDPAVTYLRLWLAEQGHVRTFDACVRNVTSQR